MCCLTPAGSLQSFDSVERINRVFFWPGGDKMSESSAYCLGLDFFFSLSYLTNGSPMLPLGRCAATCNKEVCIIFMMNIWIPGCHHFGVWLSVTWEENPITPSAGVFSPCSACRPSCATMQPSDRLPPSHDLAHPPLLLLTDFIYFLLFFSPGHWHPLLPWFQLKQELVWGCRVMFVLHHFKHPFTPPPLFNVPVSHPFISDGSNLQLSCRFG